MSSDLQWLLIRVCETVQTKECNSLIQNLQKSNSYLVKRLPEGPIFSKEPVCPQLFDAPDLQRMRFIDREISQICIHSNTRVSLTRSVSLSVYTWLHDAILW